MRDRIHIRNLRVRTIIGIHEWEQEREQDVLVSVTLHHDQRAAAADDDVAKTIDYAAVRDDILAIGKRPHQLLETLAEAIAEALLARPDVDAVDVCVDKLGALRFADSVAVEIRRP